MIYIKQPLLKPLNYYPKNIKIFFNLLDVTYDENGHVHSNTLF